MFMKKNCGKIRKKKKVKKGKKKKRICLYLVRLDGDIEELGDVVVKSFCLKYLF